MSNFEIATPVSHLFEDADFAQIIINNSDCFESRDGTIGETCTKQKLFHCEIQAIHELEKSDFDLLEDIAKSKNELELISFHISSCHSRPVLKNNMYYPGGEKCSRDKLLTTAKSNIKRFRSIFDSKVMIALENNNYYPTEAYDHITDSDFISEIINDNNVWLLYDIAHAKITAHNKGVSYNEYKLNLPVDKVIQLHISKHGYRDDIAMDLHEVPGDEEWAEVSWFLKECSSLKFLTLEYYKDINMLKEELTKLRKLTNGYN